MKEMYLKKLINTPGFWIANTSIGKIGVTDEMTIKLDSTEVTYIAQNSTTSVETNVAILKSIRDMAKTSEEATPTVLKYTWEYDIFTSESFAVAIKTRFIKMYGPGVKFRVSQDSRYLVVLEGRSPLGWIKVKPFSKNAIENIKKIATNLSVEGVEVEELGEQEPGSN